METQAMHDHGAVPRMPPSNGEALPRRESVYRALVRFLTRDKVARFVDGNIEYVYLKDIEVRPPLFTGVQPHLEKSYFTASS